MFLLDSLLISGIRWALETTVTAAEAEMNDDTVLREQLLEAEMRRELGEISDDDFAAIETDLLQRIREIKNRRDGGGALKFGAQAGDREAGATYQVEAEVSGDFHEPGLAAGTRIVTTGEHGGADVVVSPAAAPPPARPAGRAPRRAASPRAGGGRKRPSSRPSRTGRP